VGELIQGMYFVSYLVKKGVNMASSAEIVDKGMNCGVLVIVLMAVVVLPVTFFVGWYMGASEAYQQGQSVYAERVDKMLSVEQQRVLEG